MSQDSDLPQDLSLLEGLPPTAIYLTGILEAKTNLSFEIIVSFIRKVYLMDQIPIESLRWVEQKLHSGRIGEVQEYMENERSIKSEQIAEIDLRLNSSQIPSDRSQTIEQKVCGICLTDAKKEFFILRDCKHCYHKSCLIKDVEHLLKNKVHILQCYICSELIQISDLTRFMPPLLLETNDQMKFNDLTKSIVRVRCVDHNCRCIFEVEKGFGNCPNCRALIILS